MQIYQLITFVSLGWLVKSVSIKDRLEADVVLKLTLNVLFKGIALTDLSTHPPVVWHFSERNLPEDPSERW